MESSPDKMKKGSPELADFRRTRYNSKISRNNIHSPLKDTGMETLVERMQSLIVDWNQKKATDSRNMSPFGGSQVLAGLQSPLGASFELKKRERTPSETHSTADPQAESKKTPMRFREERSEKRKTDERASSIGPESLFVIPDNSKPLAKNLKVLEFQPKVLNQKKVEKVKPSLQVIVNKSTSPRDQPRRIHTAGEFDNIDSKAFQSSFKSINSPANDTKQERDLSALDSLLRQNAKKQVLAESKKIAKNDRSRSPQVQVPIVTLKSPKKSEPEKTRTSPKMLVIQSDIDLPTKTNLENKTIIKSMSALSNNFLKLKQQHKRDMIQSKVRVNNFKPSPRAIRTQNREENSCNNATIDSLFATNVSVQESDKKICREADSSLAKKMATPNSKISFTDVNSTRSPTEKEESLVRDVETLPNERPRKISNLVTPPKKITSSSKIPEALGDSPECQSKHGPNCFLASSPQVEKKEINPTSRRDHSGKSSRSSSIDGNSISPIPSRFKIPLLGKTKPRNKGDERKFSAVLCHSMENELLAEHSYLAVQTGNLSPIVKKAVTPKATGVPDSKPSQLRPATGPEEKNAQTKPKPAAKGKTPQVPSGLLKTFGSENLAVVLNKLNNKYSDIAKRERNSLKKAKMNGLTGVGLVNGTLSKSKPALIEEVRNAMFKKTPNKLKTSFHDDQTPVKTKEDPEKVESFQSAIANTTQTPSSSNIGVKSPSTPLGKADSSKSTVKPEKKFYFPTKVEMTT